MEKNGLDNRNEVENMRNANIWDTDYQAEHSGFENIAMKFAAVLLSPSTFLRFPDFYL